MNIVGQKKIMGAALVFFVLFTQPVAAEGWRDSWRALVLATKQKMAPLVPPIERNKGLLTSLSWVLMSMAVMEFPKIAGVPGDDFTRSSQGEEFKAFLEQSDFANSWSQQCKIIGTFCCQSFEDVSTELISCIPFDKIPEFYESLGVNISGVDISLMCETYCHSIQELFWLLLSHPEEMGIWLDH